MLMRARQKIAVSAALVLLLLLAMWLGLHFGVTQPSLSVGFTPDHGHFPESAELVGPVAWVTNTGHCTITLDGAYVQFENTPRMIGSVYGNLMVRPVDVAPGRSDWLGNGYEGNTNRFKFHFEYRWNGGPLLRCVSDVLGGLPLRQHLSFGVYYWLCRKGFVNGFVSRRYESPWIANPLGEANGRQLLGAETNRATGTAASRGSP